MIESIAPTQDSVDSFVPAQWTALDRVLAFARPRRRRLLGLILLLAAFCDFYALQRVGFGNLYYAAAIKSMLESWHNFFFVSFDPAGFVSVDKPPLGFWIQAASAKLLGFSGFSILLPEALAGVLSVGVLYLLVRRVFGTAAALLSALFLAITPVSVVTNRNNTIDSLLVLTVLLAAYALIRAIERGRLRWLLLCAVLVGLGFNIKMLEAYLVVPAFAAVYLLGAPLGWWTRLWHLALAGAALLALSLSWVLAVDLTPASARPYVGSSGSNSELALALGYNGIQRLLGTVFRISANVRTSTTVVAAGGGPGGASENGAAGVFRLLNAQLGGQASWLLALGVVGVFAAGWALRPRALLAALPQHIAVWRYSAGARRAAHLSPQASSLLLWGGWTLTQAVFFSVAGFFHRYYLSMLAPGVAALAGIGLVLLWRDYRAAHDSHTAGWASWRGWLLPLAVLLTAIAQAVILADYSGWNAWLTPLILGGGLLVAGVLVWYRLADMRRASRQDNMLSVEHAPTGAPMPALNLDQALDGPPAAFVVASEPAEPSALARRWAYAPLLATALGIAVLLVGPTTWKAISLFGGASGALPAAGPSATLAQVGGGPGGGFAGRFPGGGFPGGPPAGGFPGGGAGGPGAFGPPPGGAANGRFGPGAATDAAGGAPGANGPQSQTANSQLIAYLEANQGSTRYLFATLSSQSAAPYIIATGKPVMTLGGFTGSDQILTLSQLQALIRGGQVRYFLLDGGGFGGPGGGGNSQLVQWVEAHGTLIPASAYGGTSAGGQLYIVSSAAGA